MQKLKYNYFVFDGACSRFYSSFEEAIIGFSIALKLYPEHADIITLCLIHSIDCDSEILVKGSDFNAT